jgi:nitrous oxidase accessory protein NosD
MKSTKYSFQLLSMAACLLLATLGAQAQATRTWVSGVGDDANPCSRTAPCKTFAGAISKTAAGGEISVLDPGGFGAVTITKSITIDGGGVIGSILASLTNGIIINAGANDHVILRNLSINGAGNGLDGIRYLAAASVSVEDCKIFGFAQQGIEVALTNSGALMVSNSTIERCADGIKINTTAGGLFASLDRVYLQNLTADGFSALAGLALISNSHIVKASNVGINAQGGSTINIDNCLLSNNGVAVSATVASATIRLSNNSLYNNNLGINAIGTVSSAGNNRNAGNTNAGAPNGPAITVQ